MNIRGETIDDMNAIRRAVTAAFGRENEANLVDELRENGGFTLSLVAELGGEIVGHVLFSPVTIERTQGTDTALALGPVAVLPTHQNRGIGSALIRAGLDQCRALGYPLVFLIGHPTYYPRFGFRPAVPLGFDSVYVPDKSDHAHFMVAELEAGTLADQAGFVHYRPEFDGV